MIWRSRVLAGKMLKTLSMGFAKDLAPRPKAEADNTLQDLPNSSYHVSIKINKSNTCLLQNISDFKTSMWSSQLPLAPWQIWRKGLQIAVFIRFDQFSKAVAYDRKCWSDSVEAWWDMMRHHDDDDDDNDDDDDLEHKIVNTGQMSYCSQANLHLPNWMLMRTTYFSSLIYIKQGWCEMQNITYRFIRIHWQNACRRLTRPQLSLLRKETTGDESVPTIHIQREFRRSSLHVM